MKRVSFNMIYMECLIGGLQFVKRFSIGGASFHIGGPISTGTAKKKKKERKKKERKGKGEEKKELDVQKIDEALLDTEVMI